MIDERWMQNWIEFGIREFERYLLLQARFDAYCQTRELTPQRSNHVHNR